MPFLFAAGLIGPFTRFLAKARGALTAVNAVAALFMVGMGVLIFSNRLTVLNSYFPYVNPPFQEVLGAKVPQPGAAPTTLEPIPAGKPAPALTLTDTEGRRVSLAELRGKPVLITFWVPCREELPVISAAYQAHRDQGFTVLAVNFGQESAQAIGKYWADLRLEPPPFPDPDGHVSALYGVGLKTTGLPVSVFVARDGTVSRYVPFPLDGEFLATRLKEIL